MFPETALENLYFCTLYIEALLPAGVSNRGTSFAYLVNVAPDRQLVFLVTNKHVIDGALSITVTFLKAEKGPLHVPMLGHTLDVNMSPSDFAWHPDPAVDVAIAPLTPVIQGIRDTGVNVFLSPIWSELSASADNMANKVDGIEDVIFIGYPAPLYDFKNHFPIVRYGATATPPSINYEGKPKFLIDASVFPGSSGSPVLVVKSGMYSIRGQGRYTGTSFAFLGVVAEVHIRDVQVNVDTESSFSFSDPINLGVVYKACCVDELVDSLLNSVGLARFDRDVPILG